MSEGTPLESRTLTAPDGGRWRARIVSRGPASPYLAAKVSRPLVEFEREDAPAPRRYAGLGAADLSGVGEDALIRLWARARAH
jgi:hypothetical protein